MLYNFETLLKSGLKKKKGKALNVFWIGITIYSVSFALSTATTVNFIVCQSLQILGFILFVPTAITLIQWKFDNNYLKILYLLYCSWLLIVIFRGFSFEYNNLKFMLFDAGLGLFPYFIPLILLFPKNVIYLNKLFKVIVIFGVFFILYDILFHNNLLNLDYENYATKFTYEYFVKILSIPCGFIILTWSYHNYRTRFFALIVIVVGAVFSLIRARRGLLFMTISPLVFSYILYLYAAKKKLLIILFSFFIGFFLFFYGVKFYNENKYGVFRLITERIGEDSRSGVEENFYMDMNAQNWIIGKGINGQYYCPGIDLSDTTGYRIMIETDYLNIILKGGIISIVLLLLILIPAIFKGIFYSKNMLSKAAGIWILLWLISLALATVNTFSLHHLLVWISIGICYSRNIRNIPESTLIKMLSNQYLISNFKK